MPGGGPATPAKERCDRADLVARAEPPSLWLVSNRRVPARRYACPAIQRAQLTRVADLVNREHLTVQMIPTSSPRHAGNSGPVASSPRRTNPRWSTWNQLKRAESSPTPLVSFKAGCCSLLSKGPPATHRRSRSHPRRDGEDRR